MFMQPAESDFFCDAPPYPIVRACRKLGFQTPEDVCWRRRAVRAKGAEGGWKLLDFHAWKTLMTAEPANDQRCACGALLPRLERFTFFLQSGKEAHYYLAQCARCRTIVWDEA